MQALVSVRWVPRRPASRATGHVRRKVIVAVVKKPMPKPPLLPPPPLQKKMKRKKRTRRSRTRKRTRKHGDFVLRLIVVNHLDDTELSLKKLTISGKSLRRDVGAIAKRCAYEEKVKRVLQAVFFEGTSMQLEPPKTGEMFWLIEHMTTLVDTMVRFFLALRSSTVEDLYRHSVYWRSEYSFKAEKLETLVLEAESKNKMKTRATLYDETRYLPHRRESVKKMAPT